METVKRIKNQQEKKTIHFINAELLVWIYLMIFTYHRPSIRGWIQDNSGRKTSSTFENRVGFWT